MSDAMLQSDFVGATESKAAEFGVGGRRGGVKQHQEWCHVVTPLSDLIERRDRFNLSARFDSSTAPNGLGACGQVQKKAKSVKFCFAA